jgi:hypothetical protein
MGVFRKFNGKQGESAVYHTSTGYKCLAKVNNPEDKDKEIHFYAKHIVGKDGLPYTEFGFESSENFDNRDLQNKIKIALKDYGFEEVFSIANSEAGKLTFSDYSNPIPYVLEFRASAGKYGVMKVFEAVEGFVANECVEFVVDQEEEVEENLYLSILDSMGEEMRRGPGGAQAASEKARSLANMFVYGVAN